MEREVTATFVVNVDSEAEAYEAAWCILDDARTEVWKPVVRFHIDHILPEDCDVCGKPLTDPPAHQCTEGRR